MFRLEIKCGCPFMERAKEQCRHENSERPISRQQRDSNAHETVFGREADLEPSSVSKNFGDADKSREGAGQRKSQNADIRGVDSRGASCGLALADSTQFKAPGSFGKKKPNANCCNDCKRHRKADRRAAEQSELMNHVPRADAACLRILSVRTLEQVKRDVAGHTGRNEVQHDCINHFVTASTRA